MKRIAIAVFAALLIGLTPAFGTASSSDSEKKTGAGADVLRERAALKDIIAQTQQTHPDAAAIRDALKTLIADPSFWSLTDTERHAGYVLYGAVLYDLKDYLGAKDQIVQATQMADAGDFDWGLRASNSFYLRDFVDVARAVTKLAQSWPKKLADFNDDAFLTIAREAATHRDADDVTLAYVSAMHAIHWKPVDPFKNADSLWVVETRLKLERGDSDGAKAAAADLQSPATFVELRSDKRFDTVIQAAPAHFDVAKANAAMLAEVRAKVAAAPDKLEGVNTLADLLLGQDHADEALAAVSDALARLKDKPDAFSDTDDYVNWSHDVRSRALFALGRSDEALAAMAQGAAHSENGAVNVSQSINLADSYDDFDKPNEALAAVAGLDFSNASPYGRMALEDARACALVQLGNKTALDPVLAYMKAHVADGAQPYLNAMLCAGDLDAVAAEIVAELDDPARRQAMLFRLQDFLPDRHPSPRESAKHAAWLAVRGRPDVVAAIARVGRVESYPLTDPEY